MRRFDSGQCVQLAPDVAESYRRSLLALDAGGVPYVVGGAFALGFYTGIFRHTKDFDLFIKPSDRDRALSVLASDGYKTEVVFPFWLAKAFRGEDMVDLIYRAPNGVVEVTDRWFERAQSCELLDVPARICAVEEILATKLFVLNNDRSDVADVMHLFYSCLEGIDWPHLLQLLGEYWRVLFAQLILFGFVYPSERNRVPGELLRTLSQRLADEQLSPPPSVPVCNGPLLSHSQYKIDITSGRFIDGRQLPSGKMTPLEVIDATISTDDPERSRILAQL